MFRSSIKIQLTTLFMLLSLPFSVWPQGAVTVVLSSDLGPYGEAYAGFIEAFGQPDRQVNLKKDQFQLSVNTRLVVAFGGKAALQAYPDDVTLVYCLAPGVYLAPEKRRGRSVKVAMMPSALAMLTHLKRLQPDLRRLGVFWSSGGPRRPI